MRSLGEAQGAAGGLVAIILITRSRPGPRLVFHYPVVPDVHSRRSKQRSADESDKDDASDADDDSEENIGSGQHPEETDSHNNTKHDSQKQPSKGPKQHQQSPLDRLLGHSVDSLEKFLSPGRWSDGKKFEVRLDDLTFVSHPVYAGEDGTWSPTDGVGGDVNGHHAQSDPTRTTTPTPPDDESRRLSTATIDEDEATNSTGISITAPEAQSGASKTAVHDFTHIPESFTSLGTSMNSVSTASHGVGGVTADSITMFNVVFVLSTRQHEMSNELYEQVVATLSRALHYCQIQGGYVAVESKRLLAVQAKAKQDDLAVQEMWKMMVEASGLAWAIKELYEGLSKDGEARIRVNGMAISLLMPQSNDNDKPQKGDVGPTDTATSTVSPTPHSTLLLLSEREVLLQELSDSPSSSPLTYLLTHHLPTKSLAKTALKLSLSLPTVLRLATHLLHWRKAVLLPAPLHARNTYVVSPTAPIHRIPEFQSDYARKFPALPSIPQMLKALGGGKPVRYGVLIPSRDHRAVYMEILAWLVREGFVVQMWTFGWLRMNTNSLHNDQSRTSELWPVAETQQQHNGKLPPDTRSSSQTPFQKPATHQSLLSPHLRPVLGEGEDDTVSISSERTAIPISSLQQATPNTLRPPSASVASETGGEDHTTTGITPTIIIDPSNPSDSEKAYLTAIETSLQDPEFRDRFRKQILPYLDGEHAFEEIAAREGLKRAKVEEWLGELEGRGSLLTFRSL